MPSIYSVRPKFFPRSGSRHGWEITHEPSRRQNDGVAATAAAISGAARPKFCDGRYLHARADPGVSFIRTIERDLGRVIRKPAFRRDHRHSRTWAIAGRSAGRL